MKIKKKKCVALWASLAVALAIFLSLPTISFADIPMPPSARPSQRPSIVKNLSQEQSEKTFRCEREKQRERFTSLTLKDWDILLAETDYPTIVNLAHTTINDSDLERLMKQDQIVCLDLCDCTVITRQGFQHLSALKNLEELDLSDTRIRDQDLVCLESLSKLKTLYLTDRYISDKGVKSLVKLTQLRTLAVGTANSIVNRPLITKEGLAQLKKLPHLESLYLGGITKAEFDYLATFKNLKFLEFDYEKEDLQDLKKALPNCNIRNLHRFPRDQHNPSKITIRI